MRRVVRSAGIGGEANAIEARAVISAMWVSKTSPVHNLNLQLGHKNHAVMVHPAVILPRAGASLTTTRRPCT